MSKIATVINANGDRFDILKESVAAVMKCRSGGTVVFTTGGKITLGLVAESADQMKEMLMGGAGNAD